MNWLIKTMLAALLLPTIALANEWKDESSKGWKGWSGETPGWARGRGYWDGHYLPPPPPAVWPVPAPRYYFRPPVIEYRYAPPPFGWSKDAWKDWNKGLRERDKELRKREEEAYKEWRKRYWND